MVTEEAAMDSKVMIVTGASSGVGRALALHFAGEGYTVCAVARTREKLAELENSARGAPGAVYPYPCDVRSSGRVQEVFSRIFEEHGGPDVLVNNAGVVKMERFHLQAMESIDWMIDTNLKGAMYCTRMVVPSMIEGGRGRIINVASVAGTWGMKNQVIYGASKHGLVGFGDALGRELAPLGVQVITLCPGGIDTPLWREDNPYPGREKRLIDPEELVDLVSFILRQPAGTLYKKIVFFPVTEWHAG
ncbi:MAG: SDR family oxidoreductase [Spirochaetota bacterium]